MAADVNNITITGTIFDTPKFYAIPQSQLVVCDFTLACNRGVKKFDPRHMFSVNGTLKKANIQYISRGARVAITGFILNVIDQGIEKTVITCRELIPLPIDKSK